MFLFVIAYVGPRGEIGPGSRTPWLVWLAVLAALLLAVELVLVVLRTSLGDWPEVDGAYGSPAAIGQALVTDYLLAFEKSANLFPGFDVEIQGIYRETEADGRVRFYTYVVRE